VARILGRQETPLTTRGTGLGPASDPLLVMAKEDSRRTLKILDSLGGAPELQKTRTEVLRTAFSDILW
jgi:hypothetical protein